MKNSKSRRDDGMKNSSGDDSQSDKPKRTNAESSFKSYRENRSKDALAKKGFIKKKLTRSSSSNLENNNSGNDSAEISPRPTRIPLSKSGTFSRIGSGRLTSSFKGNSGQGSTNASGYKGPISDRESTSFRGKSDTRSERPSSDNWETTGIKGKSDSRSKRPSFGNRETTGFKGKSDSRSEHPSFGNRETTGFKGKSDSRSERPSFGNRETTGFKSKSDSRSERPSYGDSSRNDRSDSRSEHPSFGNRETTGFKSKSDSRSERPSFGNRETTGFKSKSDSRSERPSFGDSSRNDRSDSRAPISRSAERARAPRRETTDRNDEPRDSRPFANRNTEERAAPRSSSPYKGSRVEKTYLDSKPDRSRSYDFDDEAEARPIKRNAAITHYNKVEKKPLSFDKGVPKPKPKNNSKSAEGQFVAGKSRAESGEGEFAAHKPRTQSAQGEFAARKPRTQSAEGEFVGRKPRAESGEGEFAARKSRAQSAEGEFAARKSRAQSAEGEFIERKQKAESGEGTFKERQKARNKESSASAKEARPEKRLNADFDDYKNSSRVSTSASRDFEKSARPSKTAARVNQAAERYSKGLAKPVMGTRLNKYIANSGLCARRKADEMIANGEIRVNGNEITEMGYIVQPGDKVQFHDKVLKAEEMVYVLMNKPKDFITTTDDPQERRTVMELLNGATPHRIYPIGRLDRNTTGLLLFTNDGGLAEKLSHPSSNINKLYHVSLDKGLTKVDFDKITEGITLEDGLITVDELAFVDGMSKKEVGIRIHSGKNRIVRRIFESMGYDVLKLDRVIYAGLSKKDLTRGRWRHLSAKEIISLKHFTK